MEDCENGGAAVCFWRKEWSSGPNLGGCGKIYCEDHGHNLESFFSTCDDKRKRTKTRCEKGKKYQCCALCIRDMERDCQTGKMVTHNIPSYSGYFIVAMAVCTMIRIIVTLTFILYLYV